MNLADFNLLAGNFGQTGRIWTQADFNGDGVVNLADFNRLAANFGLSATGPEITPADWSALASAIPEPGAAVLMALSLPLLARRPRTRQRRAHSSPSSFKLPAFASPGS